MHDIMFRVLEALAIIALTLAVPHCWRRAATYFRTERLIRLKTVETVSALMLMIAQRRDPSNSTDTSALRYGVGR